jgi:hypothetical protein
MASISISLPLGASGLRASEFVVGTLAPNVATSVEVRIDTANAAMDKKQATLLLEGIKQALFARQDVITFP